MTIAQPTSTVGKPRMMVPPCVQGSPIRAAAFEEDRGRTHHGQGALDEVLDLKRIMAEK